MNATVSTPAIWVFRANSIYDPDYTSTGHQPYATDQLFAMYDHACVLSAKISLFVGNTFSYPMWLAVRTLDGISNASSVFDVLEQPLATGQLLMTQACHEVNPLNWSVDVAQYYGISQQVLLGSQEYQCTPTANPAEQVYFQVYVQGQGTDDPTAVLVHVIIEYDVMFIEPTKLNPS